MTDTSKTLARAIIPMYFDRHPVAKYNGRAYLPVILEDYTPEHKDWYNIRVLYLDVTSVSQKATNSRGEEVSTTAHSTSTATRSCLPSSRPHPG